MRKMLIAQGVALGWFAASALGATAQMTAVARVDPPEFNFYSKRLDYQGIPIKAHAVVEDEALYEAWRRMDRMLGRQPGVVANLKLAGAELHIIGRDQVTSDLPEYRDLKGKPYGSPFETVDTRTRGLGGIMASCGEENLLNLPKDRYRGGDIMSHEFSHTILNYGLSPDLRERVQFQFRSALEKGLWKNAYASSNYNEYFAEMTMWYVGTRGCVTGMRPPFPRHGAEGLKAYDPDGYALMDDIYTGRTPATPTKFAELEALPPERAATMKSPESEDQAHIIFRNTTDRNLEVYWIGHDGKRSIEARVSPMGRVDRRTFVDQVFVVVDGSGQELATYVTRDHLNLAVIGLPHASAPAPATPAQP